MDQSFNVAPDNIDSVAKLLPENDKAHKAFQPSGINPSMGQNQDTPAFDKVEE